MGTPEIVSLNQWKASPVFASPDILALAFEAPRVAEHLEGTGGGWGRIGDCCVACWKSKDCRLGSRMILDDLILKKHMGCLQTFAAVRHSPGAMLLFR